MTHQHPVDPLAEHSISMGQIMTVVQRRWWLVLLLPIVALATTIYFQRHESFQSTVRATVLIPGDTEIPGNSERPELMVLDDLSPFLRSWAFAQQVHGAMSDTDLSIDQIQASLDGSRYSRVVTVVITNDRKTEAGAIANAVESVLPAAINDYLMPDDGQQATVRIIDPPSSPSRDRDGHRLQLVLTGSLGLLIGMLIALAVGSRDLAPVQSEADSK